MDFYEKVNAEYLNTIKRPLHLWRVKLELLDHYENTIKCIEQDIDYSNAGSITCNNAQGTRKSCSITLLNADLKYIPTEDSPFWFNRKFRLYIGIVDNRHYKHSNHSVRWTNETDTYWFAKGVYITSDIHVDSTTHTISISGVDKFAQLDGSLNVLQADEMDTVFEVGSRIEDVIRDILTLDMGNNLILDPIDPIVYTIGLNTSVLFKEFTLSAGQYYGDFLNELATSYGSEVYYDNLGRLNFRRLLNDDFPYWIGMRAPVHEFKYHLPGYENPQESINLNGVNKIIVSTDNVETPNASYTAINHNPRSPLCYDKIGARTLPENGGVVIINAGNIVDQNTRKEDPTVEGFSKELVLKRCKDYGEYRLMQETCLGTSINFNCPPYLHLNEGDVIAITDPDFALDCDLYIINSITFPLGTDSLSLEISNLGFLNSDIASYSQYSSAKHSPISFGIHYILNGGEGTEPPNRTVEIGDTFTTATDYDEETHEVSFWRDGYELMNWIDNINGNTFELNTEYTVPNQNFALLANWADVSDYTFELRVKDVMGAGYPCTFSPITLQSSDVYLVSALTVNDKKYYFWGRDFESQSSISATVDEEDIIKYSLVPIEDGTVMTVDDDYISNLTANGTNGGKAYYLKYPNVVESITLNTARQYLETIILSANLRTLTINALTSGDNLKQFNFNNLYEVSVNYSGVTTFLNDCDKLEEISAINHVTLNLLSDYRFGLNNINNMLPNVTFAGGLTVPDHSGTKAYVLTTRTCSYERTINVGQVDRIDPYMGGVELYNASAFVGKMSGTSLYLRNVYLNNSYLARNSTYNLININGNIKLENGSEFLSALQLSENSESVLRIKGNYLHVDSSMCLANIKFSEVVIENDIICRGTISGGTTRMIVGGTMSSTLTTVKIYGSVDINCGSNDIYFIYNFSNLTDVYFYNDNFSIVGSGNNRIFDTLASADFKVHGRANGNVQAYCTANNIPFEVIVDD